MAKATLPTNYQDDILNVSTEGKRKYRMVYNDDGTVSFDDVTPYDQEGSDFGAGDINAINEAVNQSFDKNKLIRDMDAIGALTQEGYAPDALALKEVNDSLQSKPIEPSDLFETLNETYLPTERIHGFQQCGNIVFISFDTEAKIPSGSWTTIGTLKTAYIPKVAQTIPCTMGNYSGSAGTKIGTDGVVSVYQKTGSANQIISCSGVFMI